MEMLGGKESSNFSRKPEIMADAVYSLISKNSRSVTGQFLIDEDILKNEGIHNFTQYACNPGNLYTLHYDRLKKKKIIQLESNYYFVAIQSSRTNSRQTFSLTLRISWNPRTLDKGKNNQVQLQLAILAMEK